MPIEMSGFDEFENILNNFAEEAESLTKPQNVAFEDLFTESFMLSCSKHKSFDELLAFGGLSAETDEEFEKIPEEELDALITKETSYSSWEDMAQDAATEYMAKKLSF